MPVQFHRPKKTPVTLELTPLIDVIFQLLIFFMISSSFLYPALELTLPQLDITGNGPQEPRVLVSIDNHGQYYLGHTPIEKANLKSALQAALEEDSTAAVFFNAPATIDYGEVLDVMKTATEAGAKQFNFFYEQAISEP